MKIKNGFVLEKVGDSYLAIATGALAADFKSLVKMNETGAFLWKCIESESLTIDALVAKMTEEYDITSDIARRDAERFVADLEANGILDV